MVGDNGMQRIVRQPGLNGVRRVWRSILILAGLTIGVSGSAIDALHRAQAQSITENDYAAYLPLIAVNIPSEIEFNTGYVESCVPNAGVSYVDGTTAKYGALVNGQMVAFSYEPDGPIVAKIESGPHPGYPNWPNGFFSHILSTEGPRDGDWHFWVVNERNERISVMIYLHTDGWQGVDACQQAVIRFDNR